MLLNPVSGIGNQLRQLNGTGHHLVVDVPNTPYFMNQLKEMEQRANAHVEAQLERLQAHYEAKEDELRDLATQCNEALIFATESARINFEWYFDQIFMKSIAMNLELRQAKAKIQAQADEKVGAWQSTAEALLDENEGLRAEISALRKSVVHIGKSKTIADLKERVRETLK